PQPGSPSPRRAAARTPATTWLTGAGWARSSGSSIPACTRESSRSSTTSGGRKGCRRSPDARRVLPVHGITAAVHAHGVGPTGPFLVPAVPRGSRTRHGTADRLQRAAEAGGPGVLLLRPHGARVAVALLLVREL